MSAAALRVGWCPGALRPMMSRDGLVVRVKPRGAALAPRRALALAAAAARHGDGRLELTARANLQVRGVAEASLPALTAELDALGLLDVDAGAEARRNLIASPLMGLDPTAAFDVRPAVTALEEALAGAAGLDALPSKFGFGVSDGGATALDAVSADVRFDALSDGRFAVRLDGDGAAVAACSPAAVPELALCLAHAFAEAAIASPGLHRMRDLVAAVGAVEVFARAQMENDARLSRHPDPRGMAAEPPHASFIPPRVGQLGVADALGIAAPFGRLSAAQLDILARGAARAGAAELRLTPWRTVIVPGLAPVARDRLAEDCAAAGLIVDPADPRLRVAACAGAPGCRRGTTPVLDDAAALAALFRGGEGFALHVSGCAKGCAHPAPAPLTLVAAEGRYALVADGTAADAPVAAGLDAAEARRLLETIICPDRRL